MFDECRVDETIENFDMMYPERWANILELRAIASRMLVCFPNLKEASIKTHSVFVIQTVHHEHIGIYPQSMLTNENGDPLNYDEGDSKDLSRRYCDPPREFTGLWSTGSDGFSHIHS
jgi:predicted ATP-binding protein involved in virulence